MDLEEVDTSARVGYKRRRQFTPCMQKQSISRTAPARHSLGEGGFVNGRAVVVLLICAAACSIVTGSLPEFVRSGASANISLAPSGGVQEAWVVRYNGPGDYEDRANAIVSDNSGNVYVTGFSWGS